MVSVVMITYNHRPYIEQAVRSILDQRVDFGIELLIGEDCSTDGTRDLVLQFERQNPGRVRAIMSEKNLGAHGNLARTEGAVCGKYVAYCEGDDYWNEPTKLAQQVEFLERRPDYSLVHSHCHRYMVAQKKLLANSLTVPRDLDDSKGFEDILLGRRSPLTVTVMTRREHLSWVLANCRECTDPVWPMGDTQRWLELSRLGKVGCIHEPLATTNLLPESAGQSRNPKKRLKFYLAAREIKLVYMKKYLVAPEVERSVRQKQAAILLHHAFQAGDLTAARMLYADYLANGGKADLRSRCLLWGSESPARKRLVSPMIAAEKRWRQLCSRV